MKQIYDFSRQPPPPLCERELRRRLDGRNQQRWAAALALAGALWQLALLLLALGLATVSPALGLAALAYAALSLLVHPQQGLTLTPYSTVDPQLDTVLSRDQVAQLSVDETVYTWGLYPGSGAPIQCTAPVYFERFVFNADYTQAPRVGVDEVLISGNALENVADAYPEARFVEYHFPGIDPELEGFDWCSLKLVFQVWENDWYLVGIIHGEWTI